MHRGKKPFPATFIFILSALNPFKSESSFILQIFLFLFDQQPRDFPNSQKVEAVPGLALCACFL